MATPTPIVHIVESGDTLLGIANRYGVSLADLLAANAGVDPTRLQIGQRIMIPAGGTAVNVPEREVVLLPSPTPLPYEIRGLTSVRTPAGSLDVIGEVFNPGPVGINNVKILALLQDSTGKALQTQSGTTALSVIPPNQASPFRILFINPPPDYVSFAVRPLRGEATDVARAVIPLQVTRVEGRPNPPQFRVSGELTNNAGVSAARVRLLVTVYDTERRVIGYRYLALSESPLPPGASLTFDALVTVASQNIASFAVYAEGLR